MKRTKLCDRVLPDYTRGEEIFNSVSHMVGGGFGVVALVSRRNPAFIKIARWIGIGLALLTIVMTATVGFDPLGFIGLALMHVVVAAAIAVALRPAPR